MTLYQAKTARTFRHSTRAVTMFVAVAMTLVAAATEWSAPAGAAERETTTFAAVEREALRLGAIHGPERVLLVFDIDNTLLAMNQDLGSDQWFAWQRSLLGGDNVRAVARNFDELIAAQQLLSAMSGMRRTDETAPAIIGKLEARGFPAIVLTSRGPESRAVARRELARNGYDFWSGYERRKRQMPPRTGTYLPYACDRIGEAGFTVAEVVAFRLCEKGRPRGVSYADGLYMTAGQHKGAMLRALLAASGADYRAVLFVDDFAGHTEGMRAAFADRDTEAVTILFTGERAAVARFDNSEEAKRRVTEQWRDLTAVTCVIFRTWCPTAP